MIEENRYDHMTQRFCSVSEKIFSCILLTNWINSAKIYLVFAGMAELADALDSGSSEGSLIQVQVLLPAPVNKTSYIKCSSFFIFLF